MDDPVQQLDAGVHGKSLALPPDDHYILRSMSWRRLLTIAFAAGVLGAAPGASGRGERASEPRTSTPARPTAFSAARDCSGLVARGERLPRAAGSARVVSWNLQWFPDGEAGSRGPGRDLAWLACSLWWLHADVIAVQEIKETPAARGALAQLLRELDRLSGGRHAAHLDDCGARIQQHVGLILDQERVTASDVRTLAALNPTGDACGRQLRPGLAARLRFRGGLDLTAVSVHFKSGDDERSLDLREGSLGALPGVAWELEQRSLDADLLVLGDLNTMGCDDCVPALSASEELLAAEQELLRRGLRRVAADLPGSLWHRGRLAPLDHVLASTRMRELPSSARVHVSGHCADPGSRGKKRGPRLSDHCPIVLDLTDRDMD